MEQANKKEDNVKTRKSILFFSFCCALSVFALCIFHKDTGVVSADMNDYEYYILQDDFNGLDESNWTLLQQSYTNNSGDTVNPISIDSYVVFNNDYVFPGYEGARMVSNVYFSSPDEADTIFDISFSTEINSINQRQSQLAWGLLFGMQSQNATLAECNFFRLDAFARFSLYSKGEKVEPDYKTDRERETLGAYPDPHSKALQVRLLGLNNGTLQVYLGFTSPGYTFDINAVYVEYHDIDLEGYSGIAVNSSRSDFPAEYGISFYALSIEGYTFIDDIFEILSVKIDESNLRTAIVSEDPIILLSKVGCKPNLVAYPKNIVYTVIQGDAEIKKNNQLYIKGEGIIKIRAASLQNLEIYDEYEFEATDLEIYSINIVKTAFSDVTVYTQPIDLVATVSCNSFMADHSRVEFSVVAGPAELICDGKQMRITGEGTVIIKALSIYKQDKGEIFSFNVTDPDKNNLASSYNGNSSINCGSVIFLGGNGTALLGTGIILFLAIAFAKNIKKTYPLKN